MSRKLFCDMNPLFFEISSKKEVLRRHIKNLRSKECFSKTFSSEKLPNIVTAHRSHMIKHGPGIDPVLQYNKAENIAIAGGKINGIIVRPGESFSFWGTVGKITKRKGYKAGRVLRSRKVVAGLGGGLCNLANTLHLLILHTPMTVTEFHSHSDALAPDEGKRVPFSAGTSVCFIWIIVSATIPTKQYKFCFGVTGTTSAAKSEASANTRGVTKLLKKTTISKKRAKNTTVFPRFTEIRSKRQREIS